MSDAGEALRQVRESLLSLGLKPEALYALTVVANQTRRLLHPSLLNHPKAITLRLKFDASQHVRIDMRDRGTGFTGPQGSAEDGRGFPLVQGLSRHFGISRNGHTHAWAEVGLA